MTTMLSSADVVAANAADPCPSWCTQCCPGIRHCSDPIYVDTAEAEFRLCLVQWCSDDELTVPGWGPVRVLFRLIHHTELAAECDEPSPLMLCAGVGLAEMPALIEAQQRLLRLATEGVRRG
jgi:hypothetical protein